jgi:serine/threonine protein kinase
MRLSHAERSHSELVRGGSEEPHETSVTDVGEPALIRASSLEIARGAILAGRYQVEAIIGKGGSGIVLRAFDRVAQVPVAVKVLKPELAADPRWIERFSRELRLARQIQHPNVCRVFDIGEADGHWFITMELATAGTLRDQLGKDALGRPVEDRLADIRSVVAGLAAIHEAGIVHRDLKPDNFLRMTDGRLVLSDFGLATNPAEAPTVSIMVGTPHYMAPEVVIGELASRSSDIWAAAVVIHEILTGGRPERRRHQNPKHGDIVTVRPSATNVEKLILGVCLPALADEPDLRPQNGQELQRQIEAAMLGTKGPRRPRDGRSRARWGGVATLVVFACVGAAYSRRLWHPAMGGTLERSRARDITVSGTPSDWSKSSRPIATIEGRAHCLQFISHDEVARVVVGNPRRAEDIDLATGARTPARIAPETYAVECPVLSPRGDALLFTRLSQAGAPEIVLSAADGSKPVSLRSGTEPLWLPNGDEVLFNADPVHVGVFSLSTMTGTFLTGGQSDGTRHVLRKAVSEDGKLVAVSYGDENTDRFVNTYTLPALNLVRSWRVPPTIWDLSFDAESLMLSDYGTTQSLLRFDWNEGLAIRTGMIAGASIASLTKLPGGGHLVVTKERRSDVWTFAASSNGMDAINGRRLTTDGNGYFPSASRTGDVLVQKIVDGRCLIFLYDRKGAVRQVTNGVADLGASFDADGSSWLYTDAKTNTIMRCNDAGCSAIHVEPLLPMWPRSAPDGRSITYVTAVGTPHLYVVDRNGGHERDLGSTAVECPPVWGSATLLWGFSGAGNQRAWVEIDVETGKKTGRSKPATTFNPDEQSCGWELEPPGSIFHQDARAIHSERWEIRRSDELPALN